MCVRGHTRWDKRERESAQASYVFSSAFLQMGFSNGLPVSAVVHGSCEVDERLGSYLVPLSTYTCLAG